MEALVPGPRVLIVDSSNENREVLRVALERRGMAILEADRPSEGLRLVESHQPDLIVVDLDCDDSCTTRLSGEFAQAANDRATPLILLGTVRVASPKGAASEFVRKPYHYAPLVRKIEALLAKAA